MAPLVYDDLVLIGPAAARTTCRVGSAPSACRTGRRCGGSTRYRSRASPGSRPGRARRASPWAAAPCGRRSRSTRRRATCYVPVTNPSPDLPVQLRQGDNLYTNSIVCLDVRTGTRRWHRSLVPNDSHDWDLTQASPLVTANDRAASRAGSSSPRGRTACSGRSTVRRTRCCTKRRSRRWRTRPRRSRPRRAASAPACWAASSGADPRAFPGTNLLYVPAVDWCATFTAFEETRYIPGKLYMGGTVDRDPPEKSQGWVTAIDASTGAVKWKYRSPRPMVASVTATAGNLLLTGELTGDFLALDARTGDVLYRFNTGGSMGGGIVTYATGGTQYIAAARAARRTSGWTSSRARRQSWCSSCRSGRAGQLRTTNYQLRTSVVEVPFVGRADSGGSSPRPVTRPCALGQRHRVQ